MILFAIVSEAKAEFLGHQIAAVDAAGGAKLYIDGKPVDEFKYDLVFRAKTPVLRGSIDDNGIHVVEVYISQGMFKVRMNIYVDGKIITQQFKTRL